MFNIPQKYRTQTTVDTKQFVSRDMKKPDKDRIKENLLSVTLVWQIAGEEIPSHIDSIYKCSVIMGLDCKLKNIKDAAFFAELVHLLVKEPCVIRFFDRESEVYSFAHKRLNLTDNTQVVILDRVETPPCSLSFPDKTADKLKEHLDFEYLKCKKDKLSLYLEATVKAFIISNMNLYSGMENLMESKAWYNQSEFIALFEKLKELARLNKELEATKLPGEKVKLIGVFKKLTEGIGL